MISTAKPPCQPGKPARQTSPPRRLRCCNATNFGRASPPGGLQSRTSPPRRDRCCVATIFGRASPCRRDDLPARLPAWQATLPAWQAGLADFASWRASSVQHKPPRRDRFSELIVLQALDFPNEVSTTRRLASPAASLASPHRRVRWRPAWQVGNLKTKIEVEKVLVEGFIVVNATNFASAFTLSTASIFQTHRPGG